LHYCEKAEIRSYVYGENIPISLLHQQIPNAKRKPEYFHAAI
jgi:hypothetical protein